jgi:iron complex outermembrane receptor protein
MTPWRTIQALGVSAAALATATAWAADAPAPSPAGPNPASLIPDLAVTAERRPDPAQRVPIAITAFAADTVLARTLTTPLAVADMVPNMFASSAIGIGAVNLYTLRGLGQASSEPGFSPSVGTFIDDIYIAPSAGTNFLFFDIARAEVLRGPQATLYGRNTSGGALNIALARPADTLGGYGEFAYGAFNRKTARASLDLPLSPAVQLKISGYFQNDKGYVKNTTTGEKLNDSNAAGIRGAVQFKLTETLRWNLAGTYMRNDGDNLRNTQCDPNAPTLCNGRFAATARRVHQPFAATNPLTPLGSHLDTQMYTSHIDWVGETFALSAITGFVDSRARSAIDLSDGRPYPTVAVPYPTPVNTVAGYDPVTNIGRGTQVSQELKLTGSLLDGRVDYIAGLLYFDAQDTSDRGDAVVRNGTTDKAGYVQVDINATDRLKLTAGVRYTDEETRFSIVDTSAACQQIAANCLTIGALPTARKVRQWSPRAVASLRATNDILVYASASRGFRSGGWDARNRQTGTILPFDPETAWSYEGGIKADAFGGRVRANLAAFWLEAKDTQAPLLISGLPVVQNVGGYRNRGVELELVTVPITNLNLRASLGYQKSRYQAVTSAVTQQQSACQSQLAAGKTPLGSGAGNAGACAIGIINASGNIAQPPRTPDFSLGVGGGYDWAIPAAGIILTPSLNALYRTAYEAGTANATLFTGSAAGYPANPFAGDVITGSRNPAVWQVAAALTLRTDDNNWTLALECENCLDTAYIQSTIGTVSYLSPPRIWQIRARRAF